MLSSSNNIWSLQHIWDRRYKVLNFRFFHNILQDNLDSPAIYKHTIFLLKIQHKIIMIDLRLTFRGKYSTFQLCVHSIPITAYMRDDLKIGDYFPYLVKGVE